MRDPESETEPSQWPNVHLFELDISNANQIMDIVAKVERIAPIDVLFNNAGYVLAETGFKATSDEQLEQQFNKRTFSGQFV